MANSDRPRGSDLKGEALRKNRYEAGGAIFPGDYVKLDSDGQVVAASASDALLGVAAEPASAAGDKVCVYDDPQQQYVIQSDDATVAAQTDLNQNYNFVATAGDSSFNISRMELDGDSGGPGATLPLKAIDIERRVDNDFGANVDVIVKINNHQLSGGTGSAGV